MKNFLAAAAAMSSFVLAVPGALADPPSSPSCWGAATSGASSMDDLD